MCVSDPVRLTPSAQRELRPPARPVGERMENRGVSMSIEVRWSGVDKSEDSEAPRFTGSFAILTDGERQVYTKWCITGCSSTTISDTVVRQVSTASHLMPGPRSWNAGRRRPPIGAEEWVEKHLSSAVARSDIGMSLTSTVSDTDRYRPPMPLSGGRSRPKARSSTVRRKPAVNSPSTSPSAKGRARR